MTPADARWESLKSYLAAAIESDLAVATGFHAAGDMATAGSHYALVSANRSTLARMRELERPAG